MWLVVFYLIACLRGAFKIKKTDKTTEIFPTGGRGQKLLGVISKFYLGIYSFEVGKISVVLTVFYFEGSPYYHGALALTKMLSH